MSGYSEEELFNLINEPKKNPARIIYWTSEVYGTGQGIREYGYYPNWLPLYIFTDHGVSRGSLFSKAELENDSEAMFFHSTESVDEFKKCSKAPCYCYYSPMVFYRKNHGIEKDKEAKGTLVFPQHSLASTSVDVDKYIRQLKELGEEFQPVSICVHRDEIESGLYKNFLDAGFDLYTAGHPDDWDYVKRFYENLRKFKYATSNSAGSYLFYAVEMGIPFFIYGDEVYYNNYETEHDGFFEKYDPREYPLYDKLYTMFKDFPPEINTEQKEYVEKMLGMKDCISRLQMAKILYLSYLKRGNIVDDLFRLIKYKIRKGRKKRWKE